MTITLYSLCGTDAARPFSPHCWKVVMALHHKGLAFEERPLAFTAIPTIEGGFSKTVPILRDRHGQFPHRALSGRGLSRCAEPVRRAGRCRRSASGRGLFPACRPRRDHQDRAARAVRNVWVAASRRWPQAGMRQSPPCLRPCSRSATCWASSRLSVAQRRSSAITSCSVPCNGCGSPRDPFICRRKIP